MDRPPNPTKEAAESVNPGDQGLSAELNEYVKSESQVLVEPNKALQRISQDMCHTQIPGPTRLADPNRIRGAQNYHRSGIHQNLYTHTESHLHIHIQQIFTFNYIFRAQNLL